jgi:hypothetical protein
MNNIVQLVQNRFFKNAIELDYQASLEQHIANLPKLSTADQSLVEKIKHEGVVVTSLAELGIISSSAIFLAAKRLMPKIPNTVEDNKNDFSVHATPQQLIEYPEIFWWGLEQRLLNIVENYLGLPVAYNGVHFRRDIANEVQQKSRLWHINKEDRKTLKIIVYLNDVDENGGPFQYITQPLTSMVASSLKYNSGYIQDHVMQRAISSSYWKSCTGTAGTVIFAGTASMFHRGKVPVTSDRFALFFDYTSRRVKQQFNSTFSLSKENLALLLNNLSEQQKSCVLW